MSIATTTPTLAQTVEGFASALTASPGAGAITPSVTTQHVPGSATTVTVQAGPHHFTIDEPETLGGANAGANPVEHLLASLATCQVITYQVWAAKLGIAIDTIEVDAKGDLDVRGFFGVDDSVPAGFSSISTAVRISGPESDDRYAELSAAVESHCPVGDTLTRGIAITTNISINN